MLKTTISAIILQNFKPKRYLFLPVILFFLLITTGNTVLAADINVKVDRNPVNLNESFQLIFSADESPDDDPDFSVLESDFEILSQNQSGIIPLFTGSFSKNTKWTLTVMAKQAGVLQVPSVPFGDDRSQAVRLLVNKGNHTATPVNPNDEIFIQVSASPEQSIVQSQVIYTLRIYRKVSFTQAKLIKPESTDALIEQLGEDSTFNTEYNGQSYVVIERKYAIFPQKSGLLTIDPVVFIAEVVIGKRSGGFFSRPRTRTMRVVSEPIILDIQPVPENSKAAHWLPAEHVYLEQKWSGDLDQLQAGEPITRTLTLLAKGTTVGQLPELSNTGTIIRSHSGGELKSYPDQPLLKEQKKSDGMVAFREEKTAIIPSKAGVYNLPAIEISWWNTTTQQMQVAKIPATILTAVGNSGAPISTPVQSTPETVPASTEVQNNQAPSTVNNIWFWLSIILGLGWLTTLGVWYVSKNKTAALAIDKESVYNFNSKALQQACREHNPTAAKDELVKWGRQQWQLSSLGKIATRCDPELQTEILNLNQVLYSQQQSGWQGDKLLFAFKNQIRKPRSKNDKQQILQPLYKN
jgi:hypothetical protein